MNINTMNANHYELRKEFGIIRRDFNQTAPRVSFKYVLMALLATIALFLMVGCAMAGETPLKSSWYSIASLKKEGTFAYSKGVMANGKAFRDDGMTCATRLYPLGTILRIKNTANGRAVLVTVTDRIGKRFAKTRIDLSKGAFSKIAELKTGLINIMVERVI